MLLFFFNYSLEDLIYLYRVSRLSPVLFMMDLLIIAGGVTYTTLYNVLNFPAGCVPVTKVTAQDETNMANYPSKTGTEKFIKKVIFLFIFSFIVMS